jgi:iron(III) transport system substrate-binding protein
MCLALALVVAITGCGLASGDTNELTIYSGRSRDLVEPLLNEFAESSGIPIAVKYGDSTDLALLLAEEGDRSQADIFFSQSPGTVGFLAEKDLLSPLPDELVADVPEPYRSGEGTWVGITARQRVLVYNSEDVAELDLPGSVLDLTAPEYRGRVAVAPSNASFQDFVTAMRQQVGEEQTLVWLEGMADNDSPVYANNNAIVEAVSRGEVPLGLVNHYYNERFLAEDPSLPSRNYRFPDGDIGSLVIESSATVLAASDKQDQAQQFIEFLLERSSQEYFSEETFEYPLVSGVDPAGDLPPLEQLDRPQVDVDDLGSGFAQTQELIDRSGIAD